MGMAHLSASTWSGTVPDQTQRVSQFWRSWCDSACQCHRFLIRQRPPACASGIRAGDCHMSLRKGAVGVQLLRSASPVFHASLYITRRVR